MDPRLFVCVSCRPDVCVVLQGNVITCGFRKGLIFDVDKRASPVRLKDWNSFCEMNMRSPVCRSAILLCTSCKATRGLLDLGAFSRTCPALTLTPRRFYLSLYSIVGLESNEHHLLASSMDGQVGRC